MDEATVRAQVAKYLARQATIRDLDSVVSPMAWAPGASETLLELINAVALRIDEYSSGECDEDQLRAALTPLVTNYSVGVNFGAIGTASNVHVRTTLSSVFARSPLSVIPTTVGTRLVEVFS